MMLRNYFIIVMTLFTSYQLGAQEVSTLLIRPGTQFEGIAWAKNGTIYTVDYGTGEVYKKKPNEDIKKIGAFRGALGGAMDAEDNFYFSEYGSGRIIKIDSTDNSSVYASGLVGPAGILIDDENQLMYVANYNGNSISKIDMSAETPTPVILASGGLIDGPDGLVFSPEGDIISCNFNNNGIQRITPEGEVSRFATVTSSPNIGYIVRWKDQYIVPGAVTPTIYSISLDGEVSKLAGTGVEGYKDGAADEAQFKLPNGIALSPSGDTIAITESGAEGRIRLLTNLDLMSKIDEPQFIKQIKVFPNPTDQDLHIKLKVDKVSKLQIDLINMKGTVVDSLASFSKYRGVFKESFQLSSDLSSGIYMLRVIAGEQLYYHRVVVK